MKNKSILWGLCAVTAMAMAFEAGVVVGENTPPEKMHGMSVSTPTALDLGHSSWTGLKGGNCVCA